MNKTIISFALSFVLIVFLNANVMSQPNGKGQPPSASEMAEKTVKDFSNETSLTDEEITNLTDIFTDFFTKMNDLHQNGARPDQSEIETIENERDEKIKEILSEETYNQYVSFMKKQQQSRPEGNNPPPGGPR